MSQGGQVQWSSAVQEVTEMEHNAIKMLIPDSGLTDYPNTIIVQTTENIEIEDLHDHVGAMEEKQYDDEEAEKIFFGKRKRVEQAVNEGRSRKSKMERDALKEVKRNAFIETVMAYRCKLCSHLGATVKEVEDHLGIQHEAEYFDTSDWLEVAQKENIRLECPVSDCQNSFVSEGSRSFKIHLIDDHNVAEEEVGAHFKTQNALRKSKALGVIREQKEALMIKRSALDNRQMEAYVDEKGELRVRTVKSNLAEDDGTIDSDEELDVAADKYFQVAKNEEQVDVAAKTSNTPKASFVVEKTEGGGGNGIPNNQVRKKASILSKMGRPKGSKSVGLSKLKQLNPNISMSEDLLGTSCNRGRCGVRLSDPQKLKYHREKCHDPDSNDYICPECGDNGRKFSGVWSRVAMHLWREHQIDLELMKCPYANCLQFRAFNRARYEDHMSKHKTSRPYKCDQSNCGKSFKQERHLKDHIVRTHQQQRQQHWEKSVVLHVCRICRKQFKTRTAMTKHVNSVHHGLKPFSCQFCDYSSSNKSNLTTHGKIEFIEQDQAVYQKTPFFFPIFYICDKLHFSSFQSANIPVTSLIHAVSATIGHPIETV